MDNFSVLEDSQRREEQVELLRDRKTLDLESTILRARRVKQDEFTKKWVLHIVTCIFFLVTKWLSYSVSPHLSMQAVRSVVAESVSNSGASRANAVPHL